MLQICKNIKEARVKAGFTQEEFAKALGMKRSAYKNWEINTEPPLSTIKTIAEKLDVQAHTLLSGVIDFSGALVARPSVKVEKVMSAEEYDKIKFSLSVLDSIFSPAEKKEKDILKDQSAALLGGKKAPQQAARKKDKQKDISG